MKELVINANTPYPVYIGKGVTESLGKYLKGICQFSRVFVITDDKVDALYGTEFCQKLEKWGYKAIKYAFSNGESGKSFENYQRTIEFLTKNGACRHDVIIALGGGVVGDLAGFVAATYMRGVKYVQIPTTLLAMIDSSIGGKTAIDTEYGKNLVGTFYNPEFVLCDLDFLSTLDSSDLSNGLGEVAKYAILDKEIYQFVTDCKKIDKEFFTSEHGEKLIALCVDYKRKTVENDAFDNGTRRLLNLGHTVAHAVENLTGYALKHGFAVAYGLKTMISACKKLGYYDKTAETEMLSVVDMLVPEMEVNFSAREIVSVAKTDKKSVGDKIELVVIHSVGDCRVELFDYNAFAEMLN